MPRSRETGVASENKAKTRLLGWEGGNARGAINRLGPSHGLTARIAGEVHPKARFVDAGRGGDFLQDGNRKNSGLADRARHCGGDADSGKHTEHHLRE